MKGLLKLELIKAEKNGPDKRAVQLYILPSGRSLLKKVPGPFPGVLACAGVVRDGPENITSIEKGPECAAQTPQY